MALNLMCVHRGKDGDHELYYCTWDPATGNFGPDNPLCNGAESAAAPALATLNGSLYCVHRGRQGDTSLWWSIFDATNGAWTNDTQFTNGNQTDKAPALINYNGVLYCVHKGNAHSNLWWSTFDPATSTWSADTEFSQGNLTGGRPSLAIWQGTLYCVHPGIAGNLWWCTFDGSNWTVDQEFPNGLTGEAGLLSVGLTDYDNQLVCLCQGETGGLQFLYLGASSTWILGPAYSGMAASGPTLKEFAGTLYCVHNAADSQLGGCDLYFSTLSNGVLDVSASDCATWAVDTPFSNGNLSSQSVALEVVNFP